MILTMLDEATSPTASRALLERFRYQEQQIVYTVPSRDNYNTHGL